MWGRGVGGALHALFVGHLEDDGLALGVLEVWERNTRARAFYTRPDSVDLALPAPRLPVMPCSAGPQLQDRESRQPCPCPCPVDQGVWGRGGTPG
ncbi:MULTISPECIES: GNAT family N-acetyltransferase [Micromonospora]|uniref:GNAT family N-acetyltransferase n=1 Tax=Micromonospora TaxID=1873 RepID=UPI0009FCFDDC